MEENINNETSMDVRKKRKLEKAMMRRLKKEERKNKAKEEEVLQKERDAVYKDITEMEKENAKKEKVAPEGSFISLQHINKIYANHVQAVYDFSLDIKQHEFIVFVGPSGCGKSTTLRMIAGLEKITAGDLFIDGEYANDLEPKDRHLAMVFQNYALYPHMSVYDNIAFGLKMKKVPRDEIDRKVHEVAKKLQLEEYLDRKPGELSGGQCQRVAVGRAIVKDVNIFLMDEPLSNLDAKLRVQMRSEIVVLHESLGATTIYVTHDQTEAMTMATRIVVMNKGYIQQIGSPKEVYAKPKNLFVATFIGSPAMNILTATYDNGKITLANGYSFTLPTNFVQGHDDFYQSRLEETKNRMVELESELSNTELPVTFREMKQKELETLKLRAESFSKVIETKNHQVKFGIRPEDLHQEGIPSDATKLTEPMKLCVNSSEFLGKEYFIHADVGEERLIAKITAVSDIHSHDEISIQMDIDKIHLFDPDTTDYIPER